MEMCVHVRSNSVYTLAAELPIQPTNCFASYPEKQPNQTTLILSLPQQYVAVMLQELDVRLEQAILTDLVQVRGRNVCMSVALCDVYK